MSGSAANLSPQRVSPWTPFYSASVQGCFSGGNPTKRHVFVVGSLYKQMQNEKEKELICLASAKGGGGYFVIIYFCGE